MRGTWTVAFSFVPSIWFDDWTLVDQDLLDVYARKYDVLNRGFSGYNTEWALPVLEQVWRSS